MPAPVACEAVVMLQWEEPKDLAATIQEPLH
jgi:hypothetical protein